MKAIKITIGIVIYIIPLLLFLVWVWYWINPQNFIAALIGGIIWGIFIAVITDKWKKNFYEWFDSHLKEKEKEL